MDHSNSSYNKSYTLIVAFPDIQIEKDELRMKYNDIFTQTVGVEVYFFTLPLFIFGLSLCFL